MVDELCVTSPIEALPSIYSTYYDIIDLVLSIYPMIPSVHVRSSASLFGWSCWLFIYFDK